MTSKRLPVNIMTAGLVPGDAISNYIFSKARILRELGATVNVYADHIAPALADMAFQSSRYRPTGEAILWYHYSIYSDNVEIARASPDYKVMDYHGICPPRLFHGQNDHLAFLCQSGIDLLPELPAAFDRFVVHTEYTREQLMELGAPDNRIHKIFYCVDTSHFEGTEDADLAALLEQIEYFLFVGRVVPQKDILASLELFAEVHRHRPEMVYIIVGSREQTARYQKQIDSLIAEKGLQERVLFTGQVNNPAVLAALFNRASFYLATSEWESFCVPLAESLFFGVPTVIHDVPPLPEVSGPAGVVVDKEEPEAAATAVLQVLESNGHYKHLSEEAKVWAQQYTDAALRRNLIDFLGHMAREG